MLLASRPLASLVCAAAALTSHASGQAPRPGGAFRADLLGIARDTAAGALPAGWRVRAVRGAVAPVSQIVDSAGARFLRISGTKRAAWFVNELNTPLRAQTGTLHWTWRAPVSPEGASASSSESDDAALRIFVVFERHTRFARTPRALFYTLGDGDAPEAAMASRGPLVSITAGRPSASRRWVDVAADPARDYVRVWGRAAPRIVAVGVMQDTDQTMHAAVGDLLNLEWRNADVPDVPRR
jgi:Protein of unknown function (DUF3047)